MEKIAVTKTELVWPGKYSQDGMQKEVPAVRLPLHIRERLLRRKAG